MDHWRRQWQPTPVLLPGKSHGRRSLVGCSPWGRWESDMTEQLHFHSLEKEMATHSSILAWRIPGMAQPGGLSSMGLHRVGHDWSNLAAAAAAVWITCRDKGACVTQWSYDLWVEDHPKQMDHSGEFWQNMVNWRRKWHPTQHSCCENPMNSRKRQNNVALEDELSIRRCLICYRGRAEGNY